MITYNNWQYDYDAHKPEPYVIIPNATIKQPSSFFKYYSLNDYNVDALTNMYVYATHPFELNDPFDCDKQIIQFQTLEATYGLFGSSELAQRQRQMFSSINSYLNYCNDSFWTIYYRKLGVLSLTTSNVDMIMWALYAQNTGVCAEFDTAKFTFKKSGPFPIHYCKEIKPIYVSNPIDMTIPALIQTNLKHMHWKNENEWRLLIQNPDGIDMESRGNKIAEYFDQAVITHDRKFHYPIEALKSITLGCYFFRDIMLTNNCKIIGSEMHVHYNKICYQSKILDFIANLLKQTRINVFLLSKSGDSPIGNYSIIPIFIIKLQEQGTYRIIENKYP